MSDVLTEKESAALEELVWELTAPHTLDDIAERLGVSRRTVSRIEAGALEKLREFANEGWSGGLRDPAIGLHRACDEVTPTDGMTRKAMWT